MLRKNFRYAITALGKLESGCPMSNQDKAACVRTIRAALEEAMEACEPDREGGHYWIKIGPTSKWEVAEYDINNGLWRRIGYSNNRCFMESDFYKIGSRVVEQEDE